MIAATRTSRSKRHREVAIARRKRLVRPVRGHRRSSIATAASPTARRQLSVQVIGSNNGGVADRPPRPLDAGHR
jgi:hypothetical protein